MEELVPVDGFTVGWIVVIKSVGILKVNVYLAYLILMFIRARYKRSFMNGDPLVQMP